MVETKDIKTERKKKKVGMGIKIITTITCASKYYGAMSCLCTYHLATTDESGTGVTVHNNC